MLLGLGTAPPRLARPDIVQSVAPGATECTRTGGATDRAHRIGQEKVVTSYKLIARDTVEEKILALQQRKKAVIAASLEDEEPLMEALSMTEIEELLS